MKNFNYFILNQIKSNPDGEPTVNRQSRLMSYRGYLRNLAVIFAVLTLSIANIGQAWGAYDVPANGTYSLTPTKVNNEGNFAVIGAGVYHFRQSEYTYSADDGIKTQNTNSGVAFYLDKSTDVGVTIKHTENKNAHTVTVKVVSLTESQFQPFYNNRNQSKQSDKDFTAFEITPSSTFNISITTEKKSFTGSTTLAAGYYAVVAVGDKSNTYFNAISFSASGCDSYEFHYQHGNEWNTTPICFSQVGSTTSYLTDEMPLPYAEWYNVTWDGSGAKTQTRGFTGTNNNVPMPFYHNRNKKFGANPQAGNLGGGLGRFHVYSDSNDENKYVSFVPTGYTLNFGTGDTWTHDSTLVFSPKTENWDETEWYTPITTLTNAAIGRQIFVGLKTELGYVWCSPYSAKANISGLRTKTGSGDSWLTGGMSTSYAHKTGKFRIYANSGENNWYVTFVPHYKLTYNANGGEGAPEADYVSVEETPCQWSLSNTQPTWADHVFLGWSTNSSATKADADAEVADLGKPYGANGDVTLYAVWQACSGPNAGSSAWTAAGYTYAQNATANEMSLTGVTASNGGALSYQWYKTTSDVAHGEAISGATSNTYRPATDVAHADNWFYFCRVTEAGCSTTYTTPLSGAIVVNAASLTALECNTLYKVADMVPASITLSEMGQYAAGLSANTKFEVIGDPAQTDGAAGTPEMKNEAAEFASQSFAARMYLKGASNTTGSGTTFVPTSRAVKFIVSESGTLDIYAHRVDRLYLKKVGDSGTTQLGTSTSGSGSMVSHNVTAGTYYIYATNSSTCVYGVRLNCCSTPTAPTAFSAGSITSTGATFTITDAANAASYDIYYSTSNSAPDAGTAATTTSTEKTKAVTGLTANTTYYAWVRSVCDADHKSAWVALGTTSFTTAAAEPEALVHWTMNVATDGAWKTTATSTTDGTNISSISTSHDEGDNKGKNSATPKTAMADAEVTTAAEPTKSAKFTFTVKATKKVVPEKVTCEVFNVSDGNRTYKAQISDNNGHVYNSTNTVSVTTAATLTQATFNFANDPVLTGNVTVKVYAWKTSGSPTDFRMGQHVKLFGEVDDYICTALNLTRGGQESGTYTVGNYTGNPLTCTVNAGEPASYQWKQYTQGQGEGEAVNAVGSGSTTTSFTPNPASANTYFYACEVTDICGNTSRTPYTGTFVFNAAPAFTASTSVNIEQFVLDNSKSKFAELQAALDAAHISYDLNAGCGLDSLDDACNKTDRNNDYLGLKIKAGAKYIQMNVPAGKTLKVRFGKRVAAVKVWIDEVAQTDIPTNGTYYTYELASSASNRVVKIATADGNAVVIKQIMIGEDIKTVTLPAKITLGSTTNGTISVASTKVNVGSTVTVTATPSSGYELATLTYTPACPATSEPVDIKTTKQFNMPNGNVTINATFTAAAPAGDCITIAYFETSQHSNSDNKPDKAGKYLYGYTNSAKTEAYAYTLTTGSTSNKGQGTDASDYLRMDYGTTVTVYADNTTTGGTPASFENVTGVSVDFKMKNSSYYTSFDIYVGDTKIADNVSLSGAAQTAFTTFAYEGLAQLSGTVRIVNKGSGSSDYHFYVDNIEICTSNLPACPTPVLPDLTTKTVCEGRDADAAWDATITNSGSLVSGETVAYSWVKKGGSTPVSSEATYRPTSVTEAMAGTYVVTATVSAGGKASSMATKEVTLTVNEATEVTGIKADKATVYPTNSVTLTATANVDATWQWYTCTSAEGAGEEIINDATSASYTIASAGSAGTYYYKVEATGSCGTAARVYTLVVSPAIGGDCKTEFWFAKAADKPESATAATHITGTPSGSSGVTYTATIDGNSYPITGSTGQKTGNVTITVPEDNEGTLYVVVAGSSNRTITLSKGVEQVGQETPANSTWGTFTFDGLDAGTYTLVSSGNISWGIIALKLCSGAACNDPEVTASVDNSTACVGSSVTFTATGAHAEATYQWQKYSGGAWTDIADANASTYTIPSVATTDALKYRVIARHDCDRTSNEVTLSVPVAPVFADFTSTRTVMATQALSITDVEASDATSYAWYKSADATYDAGTDTKVGTAQELLLASGGEAAGDTYYLFCVASNACGSTTSGAIKVTVTALVEEECATQGNEGDTEFGFQNSGCSKGTYNGTAVWSTGTSNSKILVYSAPDGKYFKTMKVTIASSSANKASYNWSTDGGTTYPSNDGVAITGVTTTLTEKTIDLSAHGNVNEVKIGRNFGNGESSGTLYVSKICFEYTAACAATTVTPNTSSVNYTMGGEWTNPNFTVKHEETTFDPQPTLTYSSSNEEIASVDESGNVTFNGTAGTVTITASYAGGTISETEYCASEGSYTITVSCLGGAPKIVADGSVNMSGCNSSITLNAKQQNGTSDFTGGSYQWFRNGTEISGATSSSYTATQTGVYTVEYTSAGGCTSPSTNHATVTSDNVEPEVERLVPFQYYHVDKNYSAQMKDRHLFSVTGSAEYGSTGKNFKLTMSRNGGEAVDITTATSIFVTKSGDGQVDTVMIDLNQLRTKYSEGDELVLTCAAVDCKGNVSAVYKDEITIHVIDATPTLALICSGTDIADGTRETKKLTVGGDFLTGYNKADLCQQTSNITFDANTEWGLYTRLKENYIVTPVNGYAVFNKLNYEPFDILLLTDYPKASKSAAAATVLDDMADLCDYRPMLSFKTHMVAKSPSKWAAKGFTTSPVVSKTDGCLNLNIVCYAHPMFESIKEGENVYDDVANSSAPLVYTMLTDVGHEGSKGMQGFELAAAENFITIGLTHYNATITKDSPNRGEVAWTPDTEDRMLVTVAERQTNIEARFILFSLNCGAQSMLTEKGRTVVLKCLDYLLETDPLSVADCSFTFDNGEGNKREPAEQEINCPSCPAAGDGKWSNPANWGPDYRLLPGEFTAVRIKKPVEVDMPHAHVMEARILEDGSITIPAGKALQVKSTIRRMDGTEIYPTEISDIHIGSASTGNGTLIFDNKDGSTQAIVQYYSKANTNENDVWNWQYMAVPFNDNSSAYRNYYDSYLYRWAEDCSGWEVVPNQGEVYPWVGYTITQEGTKTYTMDGTLVETGEQTFTVPAGKNLVLGNSWTAPIQVKQFTDDDFAGMSKNVYLFNTGNDANCTGEFDKAGGRYEGGTYVTIPIHSSPYTGDSLISSLQAFIVYAKADEGGGTFTLDYDRHVRPARSTDKVNAGPMHAPKRARAHEERPMVLKIWATGSRYDDRVVLLERGDFSTGLDEGWDGNKRVAGKSSPLIFAVTDNGREAVSAIPTMEGTLIGFWAGEDNEYTLHFEYNEEDELYLLDLDNNTYTPVNSSSAYVFTVPDKKAHNRFILTRIAPDPVATGVEETQACEKPEAKAIKFLKDEKVFIFVNGKLYDATGKVVK